MDAFVNMILYNLENINWDGPAIFVVLILAALVLFKKWTMLLLVVFTIVLGWGAEDLIITNYESDMEIVSVPLIIYSIGGGTVLILALISFFKKAL
ncbi:MAG: hypothetical protein J7M24_03600 [Candidatus Latescibacteria bacterium]|nr:hypothetical protein [Candidatus Latescibacterota bacterium]